MVKEFDKLLAKKRKVEKEILNHKSKLKRSKRNLTMINSKLEMIKKYILGE